MSIKRVVPDIKTKSLDQSREFYIGFLGFDVAMDLGFVMTFVSRNNPTAQVTVFRDGNPPQPNMTVEVGDVNAVYSRALDRGVEIVYPLTDEPWGVRRFFVVDPSGTIINVMSHLPRYGKRGSA